MPFPRKLLNDGEDIVLDLHPHWFSLAAPVAATAGAVALGAFVLVRDTHGAVSALVGLAVLAALAWFGVEYGKWVSTHFVVTSNRLIYRHGLLSKRGIEIPLERVNTVFFSQSLFERALGFGDLAIESAGAQGRQEFENVRKPSAVQNEIYRQMGANEDRRHDRARRGSGAPAGLSVAEQLERLDELRRSGVLSEEEFQASKDQLLGRR